MSPLHCFGMLKVFCFPVSCTPLLPYAVRLQIIDWLLQNLLGVLTAVLQHFIKRRTTSVEDKLSWSLGFFKGDPNWYITRRLTLQPALSRARPASTLLPCVLSRLFALGADLGCGPLPLPQVQLAMVSIGSRIRFSRWSRACINLQARGCVVAAERKREGCGRCFARQDQLELVTYIYESVPWCRVLVECPALQLLIWRGGCSDFFHASPFCDFMQLDFVGIALPDSNQDTLPHVPWIIA